MANHFSADYLKSPGDDRRLDITDVFLFKSSKDPDKMLLIVNSNPTAPAPKPIQARARSSPVGFPGRRGHGGRGDGGHSEWVLDEQRLNRPPARRRAGVRSGGHGLAVLRRL
jgi:hypothetical protein